MATIRDAGFPRDSDLPTLRPDQIDHLVDQLLAYPAATAPTAAEPASSLTGQATVVLNRPRWQRRAGIAAVAAAVAAVTVIAAQDHNAPPPSNAGGPAPIVQAPAANFDCWQESQPVLTERAVNLPPTPAGEQVRLGFIGDKLCWDVLPNGGGGWTPATSPAPVPYFGTSGYGGDQYAFGIVDTTITRIEFVPEDTSTPPHDVTQLVTFGTQLAFLLPDVTDGVVRFYDGTVLAAAKPTQRFPDPIVEPVPTGLPCDPTAAGAQLNTSDFTAAGVDGNIMFTQVYLAPLSPDQPSNTPDRTLCLLVKSRTAATSAPAALRGTDEPLAYLSTTTSNGGTFIWGRLTGDATDLTLTDATGAVTSLPVVQKDATQSRQVTFVTFRPDGMSPITSVQPVDRNGQPLGERVQLP